jgi:hypothetical protein
MAEIIEEADDEHEKIKVQESEPIIAGEPEIRTGPELNAENAARACDLFAEKQKIAIRPLIKMLIPSIDGLVVIITMTRQQEEFIGDIKIQWQVFLREYFNNHSIILQIRINEEADTKRKAYTQAEQFQEMLNENDLFKQLVNRLKLKLK